MRCGLMPVRGPRSGHEFVAAGQGIPVEVLIVEELGSDAFAYGRLAVAADGVDDQQQIVLRADPRRPPAKGEVVHAAIRPGEAHLFSADTGLRVTETPVRPLPHPRSGEGGRGAGAARLALQSPL